LVLIVFRLIGTVKARWCDHVRQSPATHCKCTPDFSVRRLFGQREGGIRGRERGHTQAFLPRLSLRIQRTTMRHELSCAKPNMGSEQILLTSLTAVSNDVFSHVEQPFWSVWAMTPSIPPLYADCPNLRGSQISKGINVLNPIIATVPVSEAPPLRRLRDEGMFSTSQSFNPKRSTSVHVVLGQSFVIILLRDQPLLSGKSRADAFVSLQLAV
jgi:hypothetical protein